MKKTSFWRASCFALAVFIAAPVVWAIGAEETTCSVDPEVACVSQNAEVQAFRKSQISTLYNDLIFPAPIAVLKDPTVAAHLFEIAGVKGRVTPLGKFTDFTGVVEYFYALAANPQNHVYEVKINTLMGDGDRVAVAADLTFCDNKASNCQAIEGQAKKKATLTETGFFVFNRQNKIISFDLIIPNLGAAFDDNNALSKAGKIAGICAFLTVGHVNPITQEQVKGGTCPSYFDSKDDFPEGFLFIPNAPLLNCLKFMGSIPYGSYDRANSNTATCRQVHTLLTPLRPEVHCAHVAYDGGGKCVDFPYESYYDDISADDHHH